MNKRAAKGKVQFECPGALSSPPYLRSLASLIPLKEIYFHYLGKVPHICGGGANLDCYRYQPANDTWAVSGTLAYLHQFASFTYHKELGLVISGGKGNGSHKVEHTLNGYTIQVIVCESK